MRLVFANESTASRRRVFFQLVDATDGITPETGEAGGQPQVSSDGAAWTNTGIGTLTSVGNGRYYADLTQTLVATAGTQIETRYKSANTAECPGDSVQVVAYNPYDSVRLGLTALPNAAAEASGGLITRGTGTGQLSVTSGAVTVGTNNDKTGYSLTQSFPANFASLAITAGGAVTVGTNNDKTGYSLTQSFPANFSSLAITAGGAVTAGTVSDKTGYSLSAGSITASTFGAAAIDAAALATDAAEEIANWVWEEPLSDHTSGATYGNRMLRTTNAANYEVQVTNDNHISASVHDMQAGTITAASIAAGAIDANAIAANAIDASALATDAVNEIADGVWDEVLSGHLTAGTAGKALSDASGGVGGWALNTDQTTGLKRMITAIVGVGGETATPGVLEFDMVGETTTLRITQSTDGNDRLTVEEV